MNPKLSLDVTRSHQVPMALSAAAESYRRTADQLYRSAHRAIHTEAAKWELMAVELERLAAILNSEVAL